MRLKRASRYLALEDGIFDSRIPVRSEEEFRVGITFAAKLVGCGNVPRPNSRMEIVSSMRRIRSECRMRKDKKRKTMLTVSYEGVKVALASSSNNSSVVSKTSHNPTSSANLIISHHPIHRIFYVSHDSLDLHIFSYIAREGSTFKCFVFKAAKQSLAVNIVRTIGQAFELCHKFTNNNTNNPASSSTSNCQPATAQLDSKMQPDAIQSDNQSQQQPTAAPASAEWNTGLRKSASSSMATTSACSGESVQQPNQLHHRGQSLSLTLNMEQMINHVDNKLDKLSDKIELLERQISVLLLSIQPAQRHNMQACHHDQSPSSSSSSNNVLPNNSCSSSSSSSSTHSTCTPKTPNPSNDTILGTNTQKVSSLNSPDSLLSSPKHSTIKTAFTNQPSPNHHQPESCLLFNNL